MEADSVAAQAVASALDLGPAEEAVAQPEEEAEGAAALLEGAAEAAMLPKLQQE